MPKDNETEKYASKATTWKKRRVLVKWSDSTGAHQEVLSGAVSFGSATEVERRIEDAAVSRLHFELSVQADGVWVRDLGSKNGTFVGGMFVREARIPLGTEITVGRTVLRIEEEPTEESVSLSSEDHFGSLYGTSRLMRELFARLATLATSDATVLIRGETGTGKELVARSLHDASARRERPYVIVDCASLPENLLEVELFGHARGAFTGAVSARGGAFEQGDGGTVFLDEIGELPITMQPKLLRILEARTVKRVGENSERPVDVRFIAASHRDLRQMVNQGAFREDLYFRLAVVPIHVPPLRDRLEDLPLLIHKLSPADAKTSFDVLTIQELKKRPWLGNVRELRNFVARASALGMEEALRASSSLRAAEPAGTSSLPPVPTNVPFKELRDEWMNHLEREYLSQLLVTLRRNITEVAEISGLHRAYVYRLMKKHDL